MKTPPRNALWILPAVVMAVTSSHAAEDGELLERTTISLTAEQRAEALERVPDVAGYIDSNRVPASTYSSEGLRVKGYLVIPKGELPFPCLIVNRGGNRDFGALSQMAAVVWLGSMAERGYVVIASQYRGVAGGEGMEEFGGAVEAEDFSFFVGFMRGEGQGKAKNGQLAESTAGPFDLALHETAYWNPAIVTGEDGRATVTLTAPDRSTASGIRPDHAARLARQLRQLNDARSAKEMNMPGWKLHPLVGELADHWSITVNGNWRVTFTFEGEDAILVDYQDYH